MDNSDSTTPERQKLELHVMLTKPDSDCALFVFDHVLKKVLLELSKALEQGYVYHRSGIEEERTEEGEPTGTYVLNVCFIESIEHFQKVHIAGNPHHLNN